MTYQLIHGDCLDVDWPQVDAIITDVPYGVTACKWDSIIPFPEMWAKIKGSLKPRGAFVTTASQPFTSALVMSNPKWFKYCWYWKKEAGTGFLNAKKYPLKDVEEVVIFCEGVHKYNPQMKDCKPYIGKYSQKNLSSNVYGNAKEILPVKVIYNKKYPTTLLEIKRDTTKKHPTQKPVALYEYLIKTYTNEGDTVLDFCMGSGTTGVACINTGRNFIGIEKELKYFEIGQERMRLAQERQTL